MAYRTLEPNQSARVHVHDIVTGEDVVIHESNQVLLEAPNWSVDGERLLLNGDGLLWSLAPETGAQPEPIPYSDLAELNNDHVLDPGGELVYLSAMDGHIYRASLTGGAAEKVTPDDGMWHFLHGVSPDGQRLAYVQISTFDQPGRLVVMPYIPATLMAAFVACSSVRTRRGPDRSLVDQIGSFGWDFHCSLGVYFCLNEAAKRPCFQVICSREKFLGCPSVNCPDLPRLCYVSGLDTGSDGRGRIGLF